MEIQANVARIPRQPGLPPDVVNLVNQGSLKLFRLDLSVARANPVAFDLAGSMLWVVDASTPFVSANVGMQDNSGDALLPWRLASAVRGVHFERIFVTNAAQGAGAFLLFVYNVRDIPDLAFQNAASAYVGSVSVVRPTTNADQADTNIAALGTLAIPANPNYFAVVISSDPLNVGAALRVSKTGGARGEFLQAGMSVIVNDTDAINVFNPDPANAANVGVRFENA